ncbi:MAG: hypothetical protein ACXACH_05505, partial [Candidatus Hermodarchaeia archaeon]
AALRVMRHVTGSCMIYDVSSRGDCGGNPRCPHFNAGSQNAQHARHIKRGPVEGIKAFRPPMMTGR